MPLHEESRDLTAFITDDGLLRFKRIPYGLASAPSFFQKMMGVVLERQAGVQCYLDDILVFGSSKQEHDTRLKLVIQKLDDAGLGLNYRKCVIGRDSVDYLGAHVSGRGIEPRENRVAAIAGMHSASVDELR